MSTRPILTPLGSARASLELPRTAADAPPFPADLIALARAHDLNEETLHLAWELTRLELEGATSAAPSARDDDRFRGLLCLLLLLFDAASRGSTRMRIGHASRAELRSRVRELGFTRPDIARIEAAADEMLASVSGLREDGDGQLALGFQAIRPTRVLVGPAARRRPLVLEADALSMARFDALETRLARRLLDRAPPLPSMEAVQAAVRAVCEHPVMLTEEQRTAVELALTRPVTVITGGPGTGKTSIVVAILRALARLEGPDAIPPEAVAIAAPTGKAADRLKEQVHGRLSPSLDEGDRRLAEALPDPRTVHRLLDWAPRDERFRRHEGSPLAERLVLVDESSMLDAALAERLVAALRPDARLVLLGDADQLPSVDAGAVLGDLVAAASHETRAPEPLALARLTKSHRMDPSDPAGSHVLSIALCVQRGVVPALHADALRPDAMQVVDASQLRGPELPRGVSFLPARNASDRDAFLRTWMDTQGPSAAAMVALREPTHESGRDEPALDALFARAQATRLLTVTRSVARPTGADAINAWFATRLARERGLPDNGAPLIGEPVMIVRNDYERQLWNGDTGLVLWLGERTPMVVFRRGGLTRSFRLDTIRSILERAHAVTVHKAQGSEHDAVALVLPDEDVPRLLTREILYTAMTRARRSVVVVGDHALFARAVTRPSARDTSLTPRLLAGAPSGSSGPERG